jgi:hypothetical protein
MKRTSTTSASIKQGASAPRLAALGVLLLALQGCSDDGSGGRGRLGWG